MTALQQIVRTVCHATGSCDRPLVTIPPPVPEPMPQPSFLGEIDIHHLSSILMDLYPDIPIYLSDKTYKLCTKASLDRFLLWDSTNLQPYIAQYHDCDDFTYRLQGQLSKHPWSAIPSGIVWTNLHAIILWIENEESIWFIEPQTDSFQRKLKAWQGTSLRFIIL